MNRSTEERYRQLSIGELIRICGESGTAEAWEEFVHRVQPVIAATVMRTVRRFGEHSRELQDDLIQETFLRVCANRCRLLREFRAEHPEAIFGLLKSVAFSAAQDHFRHQLAGKGGGGKPKLPIDTYVESTLPGSDGALATERQILLQEIEAFLASQRDLDARPRERGIFWLHHRNGMSAREIAAIPAIGLTEKGVESVIHRLTVRVRAWLAERPGRETA